VYLAIGHINTPFITIYKRSGATLTKLANPATLPASNVYQIAWSADGVYLAAAHNTTPYVTIYKRSGDTFTKLANPTNLPAGGGRGVSFSADGVYLAVGHLTTPFITIYKRSGDTFTKLANPASLPAVDVTQVAFSPDGLNLSICHVQYPYLTQYTRSADVFTKVPIPLNVSQVPYVAKYDPTSTYLVVGGSSFQMIIFKKVNGVFLKLKTPNVLPPNSVRSISFDSTGTILAVGHVTTPRHSIYRRFGDDFIKMPTKEIFSGNGYAIALTPDGNYLYGGDDYAYQYWMEKIVEDRSYKVTKPYGKVTTVDTPIDQYQETDGLKIDGDTLPGSSYCMGTAFTPSGSHLVFTYDRAPYLNLYKRVNGQFELLPGPVDEAEWAFAPVFSADGVYLSVSVWGSTYHSIYKLENDVLTKLPDPTDLPGSWVHDSRFSPDGVHLVLGLDASPYIHVYKRVGDTFTKLVNPITVANKVDKVQFSPDGVYLYLGLVFTPHIAIFKRAGDVFTQMTNPTVLPTGTIRDLAVSPDGLSFAVSHYNSPYITFYRRFSDSFYVRDNPDILPPAAPYKIRYDLTENILIGGGTSPPKVFFYGFSAPNTRYYRLVDLVPAQADSLDHIDVDPVTKKFIYIKDNGNMDSVGYTRLSEPVITKITPMSLLKGLGYAQEYGVLNETKEITRIWR
jgi:WD40 repeat protein